MVVLTTMAFASAALATLPPTSPEAKAKAAETAAKSAWSDKVAAYRTCVAQDKVADAYRASLKAVSKDVPKPIATPPCTDPGPFVSQVTPVASKPLEASGAHSPPGTATTPPSTTASAAGPAKN
jgi:hypothetical protein